MLLPFFRIGLKLETETEVCRVVSSFVLSAVCSSAVSLCDDDESDDMKDNNRPWAYHDSLCFTFTFLIVFKIHFYVAK